MSQLSELERGHSTARLTALTRAWRDTLATACGHNPPEFQLALGAAGLSVEDSSGLLRYSDISVPQGPAVWVDDSGGNTRSEAYLNLLLSLLPAVETGLHGLLGPKYPRWIACRNADPRGGAHLALFNVWATNNLPPERAATAIHLYRNEMEDPLMQAVDRFFSPLNRVPIVGRKGRVGRLPVYRASYEAALDCLENAGGTTIRFESGALSDAAADSQPQGPGRARYFWSRSLRQIPDLRPLDMRALRNRITIEGRIDRVGSIATVAGDWLDGFELERAWAAGDDPTVWDEAAGGNGWGGFFGAGGSLARRIGRVVLADGYDLTVTSHARYTAQEVALIRSEATGGVWPIIAGEGAPTHKVRVTHHADGTLSHRLTLAPGAMQILGGLIRDAPY